MEYATTYHAVVEVNMDEQNTCGNDDGARFEFKHGPTKGAKGQPFQVLPVVVPATLNIRT
jgi:hypothetical protein